ncbi:hypothetical protein [Pasteurella sp. PK-2025]|uniref:hypothetical protein n=1 Tax=Pasteurella sp. PK-2025 TaxID=3413133 RepID=UPI003C7705C0
MQFLPDSIRNEESEARSLLKNRINETQTRVQQVKKIALYSQDKQGKRTLEGAIVWGISYG